MERKVKYFVSGTEVPPHFFVDGYNIIGYWKKLQKRRDKGDMAGARDALFDEVSQFAHYRGCQCTLVYDAAGNQHGPGTTQVQPIMSLCLRFSVTDDPALSAAARCQAPIVPRTS